MRTEHSIQGVANFFLGGGAVNSISLRRYKSHPSESLVYKDRTFKKWNVRYIASATWRVSEEDFPTRW